jgi:signal transduction histidine kinase
MFRSTSLRLAALYTAAFALSVVALGAITLLATRTALRQQFDARIEAESSALADEFRTEGLAGVAQAVQERERTRGALIYGFEAPGRAAAGRLALLRAPLGWSKARIGEQTHPKSILVLTTALPGGYRLSVGDDDDRAEALQLAVLRDFALAFAGVVVLGIVGGYGLSRDVHWRLASMSGAVEAIIDGDLSRRMPLRGSDDELDRVAGAFNRMLDRISVLMESLRHVSNDIAHDLRTPLTRLRHRLEAAAVADSEAQRTQEIDAALEDCDAILGTFAALLRISQVESGARRSAFQPTDLSEIARTVGEAYAPSAEELGQTVCTAAAGSAWVQGDRDLLVQMAANLVENSLRHGGPRANVVIGVKTEAGRAALFVGDDGPGVPPEERERIFERFYRMERSRSTPGDGLGLALVAAVARLHGAGLRLEERAPGVETVVSFAPTSAA